MTKELVAPCGMHCRLCYAYQRDKNRCQGCHSDDGSIPNSCQRCTIRNCPTIRDSPSGFCYACSKYPCRRLRDLDKRYRTKYRMSMIENLAYIQEHGVDAFLQHEAQRWTCPVCGSIVSVHRELCPTCQAAHVPGA
ncbi:MAG: DUF3795 domain-containing protein [Anaerolineae bacterium]